MNERKPMHDPTWIPCSKHEPQEDLPVRWQPHDDGPNVQPQFIAARRDIAIDPLVMRSRWWWMPTGIYRTLAWENTYARLIGDDPNG
jgi:hypothetical protein